MLLRLLPRAPTLPTQCAICRGWEAKRVCAECQVRYAPPTPRCRRCALRVPDGVAVCGACLTAPPPYDTVLAALDYAHPWDRLIGRLKFHAALDLATPLAQMLLRTWQAAGTPAPDWLLPVPLSAERLRERGYNQAWELARLLARGLGCRADAHLVLRIRDTPHQLAFPVEARAANVQAAFAVEPTRRAELRGRRIAVIDDVMTTGATAAEIARVLRQAGAAAVDVAVVARTPAPADE
ncbi:MAG: ComF family protein [Rhizobacter sp.]